MSNPALDAHIAHEDAQAQAERDYLRWLPRVIAHPDFDGLMRMGNGTWVVVFVKVRGSHSVRCNSPQEVIAKAAAWIEAQERDQ
jgi:hypothetical protein